MIGFTVRKGRDCQFPKVLVKKNFISITSSVPWMICMFLYFQTFGDKLFGSFSWLIPFFVACSTFGALNGAIFASARLFFVGARQGHLPQAIALINIRHYTPVPSLIFLVSVNVVINYINTFQFFFFIVCTYHFIIVMRLMNLSMCCWAAILRFDLK